MHPRRLLRQWDIRPDRGLGQNFLVDQSVLERIVAAADLTPDDSVVEIGAGTGALTRLLAAQAGHVLAVELDQRLMPLLESELSSFDNVTLVQADILSVNPAALIREALPHRSGPDVQYSVVANLPYYITSAVLRHLLEADPRPERMVITVQREVGERITAHPGDMSVLAVSVQFYGDPELLFRIKPGSFYPSPDVESAVVRVDSYDSPPLREQETDVFFRVVRAGFSQRRKQLHNALSAGLGSAVSKSDAAARLREAGVDPRRRAQTLSIDEWVEVTQVLSDLLDS